MTLGSGNETNARQIMLHLEGMIFVAVSAPVATAIIRLAMKALVGSRRVDEALGGDGRAGSGAGAPRRDAGVRGEARARLIAHGSTSSSRWARGHAGRPPCAIGPANGGIVTTRLRRSLAVAALVVAATRADATLTREDFVVETTQDLIDLCTVADDDPLRLAAIGFCHGYLVGAYQYQQALTDGPKAKPWVCPPSPPPSRVEAVKMFVAWCQANPRYMGDAPVETLGRFLFATWPCAAGTGGK